MMRILRFDSVGGASGDMILAALIGLGIDMEALRQQLTSLALEQFEVQDVPFSDHGLNGIQVTVSVPKPERLPHRNFTDIRKLIEKGGLSDQAKAMSIKVFERLAEAEARVHNTTPDKINFHEVGAIDSIVDIVGSCIVIDMLAVDEVVVGPLPLGRGTTRCEHGILPIPVPATVELLKGHPVVQTDEPFELVTPTGAALLTAWKSRPEVSRRRQGYGGQGGQLAHRSPEHIGSRGEGGRSEVRVMKTANGFGHRKLKGRPNLLRAILLEAEAEHPSDTDECLVLECNLDDTVPELLGSLTQKLIEKGTLDVFTTPVQMKKQRPGILLTVLCRPEDRESFLDLIFSETTTFGIREYITRRTILERRHVEVETPYGKVRVKIGSWKGKDITRSPEHDDCVRCANEHGVSVRTVYEAALRAE